MPEPSDKTPKSPAQIAYEQQCKIEKFLDGDWVVKDVIPDDDDDLGAVINDDIVIVLNGYSNWACTPVATVGQYGPMGKAVAAQICASSDMVKVLRDLHDYFHGRGGKTSNELLNDISNVIAKARPPID